MILVYAIVDDPGIDLRGMSGLRSAELRCVPLGDLGVVVSVHQSIELAGSAADLWGHDRVVSALMSRATLAPVRFGTVLAGIDQVIASVESQAPLLRAVMGRVRGRVELAVRATADGPAPSAARPVRTACSRRPGREYLRALAADQDQVGDALVGPDLDRLHTALAGHAEAAVVTRSGPRWLAAAYLLTPSRVAELRAEAMSRSAPAQPSVRLSLTGPWAPYSFVTAGAAANA